MRARVRVRVRPWTTPAAGGATSAFRLFGSGRVLEKGYSVETSVRGLGKLVSRREGYAADSPRGARRVWERRRDAQPGERAETRRRLAFGAHAVSWWRARGG